MYGLGVRIRSGLGTAIEWDLYWAVALGLGLPAGLGVMFAYGLGLGIACGPVSYVCPRA